MQVHTLFRYERANPSLQVFLSLYSSSESLVVDQNDVPLIIFSILVTCFRENLEIVFVRNHILINDIKTPLLFDLLNNTTITR